jgi:hypothetical protein
MQMGLLFSAERRRTVWNLKKALRISRPRRHLNEHGRKTDHGFGATRMAVATDDKLTGKPPVVDFALRSSSAATNRPPVAHGKVATDELEKSSYICCHIATMQHKKNGLKLRLL